MIRFDVLVTCDWCDHGPGDRYTTPGTAEMRDGVINISLPRGWTKDKEGEFYCPRCTERRAMEKALETELPDPEKDPEPLKATKERRMKWMKKAIREDLADPDADEYDDDLDLKHYVKSLQDDDNAPDFLGHFGEEGTLIEVRANKDFVEVKWPGDQNMSLTLRHKELQLLNPPPFIDHQVMEWVQGCLRTMTPKEVEDREETLAQ